MASTRPTRIAQPSSKLSADNIGELQLASHRHAVNNARKAKTAKQSAKSPDGSEPESDLIIMRSMVPGGNTTDAEFGSTSDATVRNPRKRPIVLSDDDNFTTTPPLSPSSQQVDSFPHHRKKKKKKTKKRSSTGKYIFFICYSSV